MTDPTTPDTLTAAAEPVELAKIAHGEPHLLGRDPIATAPSPWQAVEDALDRLISSGHVITRPTAVDRATLTDDLVDWWHAYGAGVVWSVSGEPLSLDLGEAAGAYVDHATRARTADREDGAALIAAERRRQVEAEGWTATGDDRHAQGELALAAACYATPADSRTMEARLAQPSGDDRGDRGRWSEAPAGWPWNPDYWKPTADRIRELTKAGALLAAEIDRLRRAAVEGGGR